MHFEIVGRITEVETIAAGPSVRIRSILRKRYGRGRWRKLKGVPLSVFGMVRYGLPKSTGSKRME